MHVNSKDRYLLLLLRVKTTEDTVPTRRRLGKIFSDPMNHPQQNHIDADLLLLRRVKLTEDTVRRTSFHRSGSSSAATGILQAQFITPERRQMCL